MKVKTILLTLLVCLSAMFVMAACFDNTGSTGGEPSVHKHAYIAVEETPSTCIKAGTKSHYKCNECGKLFVKDGDEYVERTEADLALPLAAHSFNGITVKTNPTKTIYTAFEDFDPTGIKVVKTCSVAGCEGEEVEGFVPVEHKASEDVINNYYIKGKDPETLKLLLGHILAQRDESKDLAAISFVEDKDLFQDLGFMPEKVWTRYVKMKKTPVKNEFIQEKQ